MRSKTFIFLLSTILLASPCHAKTAAKPKESSQSELEKTRNDQKHIEEQTRAIEAELTNLQAQLVKLAAMAQKSESELSSAEENLNILTTQLTAKELEFKTRQAHLSTLVSAAISLSHTPPEAMIMMPGDVTQTMKAARALKMSSAAVKTETQSLGMQLIELQTLKDKVSQEHQALLQRQESVKTQQDTLNKKLTERKKLQRKLGLQAKETQNKLAILAKKTKDTQELVEKVEETRKPDTDIEPKKRSDRSFASAKGHIRTPVSGKLIHKFGQSEGKNATTKGLTIETRSRASVTAPFDGEVVFTGPFLKYGRIVIIHHSDSFHTLLAGLEKIDVEVGQFLLEGEPIGAMGEGAEERELYVELRKDNQPINPAPWMSAFKRK